MPGIVKDSGAVLLQLGLEALQAPDHFIQRAVLDQDGVKAEFLQLAADIFRIIDRIAERADALVLAVADDQRRALGRQGRRGYQPDSQRTCCRKNSCRAPFA